MTAFNQLEGVVAGTVRLTRLVPGLHLHSRQGTRLLVVFVLLAILSACDAGGPGSATTRAVSTSTTTSTSTVAPTSAVISTTTTPPENVIQAGNPLPVDQLEVTPFTDLTENHIGDVLDAASLARLPEPCPLARDDWVYTHVGDLGYTWVRISVDFIEWETARSRGEFSQPSINPCQEAVISLLANRGVTLVHTTVHWDPVVHADRPPDYSRPEEVKLYLDYVRGLVRHFRGRIQYYEILNEAVTYVALADYLNLVRQVIPVIQEEDPDAKIVVGGSSYLIHPGEHAFILGVVSSDVMPLVDAVNLHPLYGASPEMEDTRQYYYDYPALVRELQTVAADHGFGGEFLAEELTWSVDPTDAAYQHTYGLVDAAKYYARGIVINRGLGLWAALGGAHYERMPDLVRAVRHLTTLLDLAQPADLAVTVEGTTDPVASYGFSLPNGDRLLAVWIDGAAMDDYPGTHATVTVEGATSTVMGIDVVTGQQRELITAGTGSAIVIEGLILQDYPIFVRLIDWAAP